MMFPYVGPFTRTEQETFGAKTKFLHDPLNKAPFNPVKSLAHIEFDCHKTLFPYRFVIQEVHKFKGHQHIVCDKAIRGEFTLVLLDDEEEKGFKSVGKGFGNELVDYIA